MTLYYLAYGSNLHPIRLTERVPSTRFVGISKLQGYELQFHQTGQDDSGKCNIIATENPNATVHAAIYAIDKVHKSILDEFEGPGYEVQEIEVECNLQTMTCFAYVSKEEHIKADLKPYHWYKNIVELGAHYHDFPETYLQYIKSFDSIEDQNTERREKHDLLIDRILSHNTAK